MTLISRLEAATGPSRELDAEIAVAVGVKHRSRRTAGGKNKGREWLVDTEKGGIEIWAHHPPAYTGSLDAAMTLVPEGWNRRLSETDSHRWWVELREGFETSYNRVALTSNASTPAIALCIAALKARETAR